MSDYGVVNGETYKCCAVRTRQSNDRAGEIIEAAFRRTFRMSR